MAQSQVAPIKVCGLRKSYGAFEAIRGIDFEVAEGEVFGLLGPNGAGKTTTVEILEGLRTRTAGDVSVLGCDPAVQVRALKDRIGVCLQATNLPEKITVREAVNLFAAFYSRAADTAQLLERLQLWQKRDEYYVHLSGGQKQRLALALSMVNDPQLLFLDEPTTGLDPQVRLEIHSLIQQLKNAGCTVLLTTHYIEEAEKLCDRVAIVDGGKIIAIGTPREIQSKTVGDSLIEMRCETPVAEGLMPPAASGQRISLSKDRMMLTASSMHPTRTLVELVKWVDQQGIELADIHLKRPTLEDVFIELTGKSLRD